MRLDPLAIALVAAATLGACAPLSRFAPRPEPVAIEPAPPPPPVPAKNPAPKKPPAVKVAVEKQVLPADPVPQQKPLPPDVPQLYADGLAAHEAGQFDAALRDWERVWVQTPDYADVGDRLMREYLVRGLELFAEGKLDDAIRQWEMAQRVRPADTRVQAYLERAREQQVQEAPAN